MFKIKLSILSEYRIYKHDKICVLFWLIVCTKNGLSSNNYVARGREPTHSNALCDIKNQGVYNTGFMEKNKKHLDPHFFFCNQSSNVSRTLYAQILRKKLLKINFFMYLLEDANILSISLFPDCYKTCTANFQMHVQENFG